MGDIGTERREVEFEPVPQGVPQPAARPEPSQPAPSQPAPSQPAPSRPEPAPAVPA